MIKNLVLVGLTLIAPFALADGHGDLGLKKRQPDTAMNVTSVKLGQDLTSVSAGQGRGFTPEGRASGRFQGFWELVDDVVVMRNVVNINNGQMNLDVIKFNPLTRELVVQAYILK